MVIIFLNIYPICYLILLKGFPKSISNSYQGRIQDFKLGGGAHLKKLSRAEGGAKIVGVIRVKNHDFTQKKIIFVFQF